MTVYRYTAVSLEGEPGKRTGELAGTSAAEVRASLRRVGLQVVRLRPLRRGSSPTPSAHAAQHRSITDGLHRHLRRRRRPLRAELYDDLATMLGAGMPLLEALDAVVGSTRARKSALRSMLVQVRESLRSGASFGQAIADHPTWFEPTEIAMIQAGQHSGSLIEVLKRLAERHERSDELANRLVGALAYPLLVTLVGLGVVVFLSTRTLPDLVQILVDAGIETPALTANVMAFGRLVSTSWPFLLPGVVALVIMISVLRQLAARHRMSVPRWVARASPRLLRRLAVSRVCLQLAELIRTGVPVVDALRVLAPTTSSAQLRARLAEAANRAERGDELADALHDERWFDGQFRRLLRIGQATGELDDLLERVGHRYARQSRRLIDRLATILEPAAILTLAVLVGTVVIAALLPLLRLREILS